MFFVYPKYPGVLIRSLARPRRKQARKHVRDARDFNNIETRAVIKSPAPLQGTAPKKIHAILTETLPCFLPGRAKDLSASLYGTTRKSVERQSRSSKRTATTRLVFSSVSCVCSQRYFPDVSASTWLSPGKTITGNNC